MDYIIESASYSHIGCNRGENEDNIFFDGKILPVENKGLEEVLYAEFDLKQGYEIVSVFDGMGGHEDGQVASYIAARSIQRFVEQKNSFDKSRPFLEGIIKYINDDVRINVKEHNVKMGTTVAFFLFNNEKVYVVNVGDSKAFSFKNNAFIQLSKDHSDKAFLLSHGVTNRRPRLTQFLGMPEENGIIQPYITKDYLKAGDKYLLCSDGLTDMVENMEIVEILSEQISVKEIAKKLISKAIDNGGKDNITVIVSEVKVAK